MYKALGHFHLDHCDIIYHIPSVQTQSGVTLTDLMEKAERIQYQAALAVTSAWQGSSRSEIYEECGRESLSECRWCRRILQIHKIVNNKTPSYLYGKKSFGDLTDKRRLESTKKILIDNLWFSGHQSDIIPRSALFFPCTWHLSLQPHISWYLLLF